MKTSNSTSFSGASASSIQPERTPCEIWTRVMGYHRPVSHFNIGKKSEHFSRQHFAESISQNSQFCMKY